MGSDRGDAAGYVGWFLLGSVIGAVTAMLLTPRSGVETRAMLNEKTGQWSRRAQELADEAQGRAGQWLDKSRELFEEQTQRLLGAFEAGKEAMREETRRSPVDPRT
jgi:gas vesicle protein